MSCFIQDLLFYSLSMADQDNQVRPKSPMYTEMRHASPIYIDMSKNPSLIMVTHQDQISPILYIKDLSLGL